jgi:hypothetical protein
MRAVRSNRVRRKAGEHGITLAGPQNETKAIIVKANHDLRIAAWQLFRWRHELPMNKSMIAGRFGSERGTRFCIDRTDFNHHRKAETSRCSML